MSAPSEAPNRENERARATIVNKTTLFIGIAHNSDKEAARPIERKRKLQQMKSERKCKTTKKKRRCHSEANEHEANINDIFFYLFIALSVYVIFCARSRSFCSPVVRFQLSNAAAGIFLFVA